MFTVTLIAVEPFLAALAARYPRKADRPRLIARDWCPMKILIINTHLTYPEWSEGKLNRTLMDLT